MRLDVKFAPAVETKCNRSSIQKPHRCLEVHAHMPTSLYTAQRILQSSPQHIFHNTLTYLNTMPKLSETNISSDAWNAHPVIGYVRIAQSLKFVCDISVDIIHRFLPTIHSIKSGVLPSCGPLPHAGTLICGVQSI
jgi:hypothetical protein